MTLRLQSCNSVVAGLPLLGTNSMAAPSGEPVDLDIAAKIYVFWLNARSIVLALC